MSSYVDEPTTTMSSSSEDYPYPSAHKPSEIAAYLRQGVPVVPVGPYYVYDNTRADPPPECMCSLDMLAEEVSRWEERCGKRVSLAPVHGMSWYVWL